MTQLSLKTLCCSASTHKEHHMQWQQWMIIINLVIITTQVENILNIIINMLLEMYLWYKFSLYKFKKK